VEMGGDRTDGRLWPMRILSAHRLLWGGKAVSIGQMKVFPRRQLGFILLLAGSVLCCGCKKGSPPAGTSTDKPAQEDTPPVQLAQIAPGKTKKPSRRPLGTAMEAVRTRVSRAPWRQLEAMLAKALVEAIRDFSSDPNTYLAAGNGCLEQGNQEAAVQCFRRGLRAAPESLDLLRALAIALAADHEYARAIAVYERILRRRPGDRTARFNLAVSLSRVDRLADAQRAYERLLELDPDFLRARYNLAGLYEVQGKLSRSRDQWRQIIARDPEAPHPYAKLGELSADLGDPEAAMDAYAEAAKRDAKNPQAWLNLAGAAVGAGSFGRAIVATQQAAKLAPQDSEVWVRLGELHLALYRATDRRESFLEAVEATRSGVRLDPGSPTGWGLLGDLLEQMHNDSGDPKYLAGALRAWKHALELDPGQARISKLLREHQEDPAETPGELPTE